MLDWATGTCEPLLPIQQELFPVTPNVATEPALELELGPLLARTVTKERFWTLDDTAKLELFRKMSHFKRFEVVFSSMMEELLGIDGTDRRALTLTLGDPALEEVISVYIGEGSSRARCYLDEQGYAKWTRPAAYKLVANFQIGTRYDYQGEECAQWSIDDDRLTISLEKASPHNEKFNFFLLKLVREATVDYTYSYYRGGSLLTFTEDVFLEKRDSIAAKYTWLDEYFKTMDLQLKLMLGGVSKTERTTRGIKFRKWR